MNQIDNPCLLVTDLPEHLTVKKLDGDDEVECFLCAKPKKLKLRDMRKHVGKHVLLAFRDISEHSSIKSVEVGADPCGCSGWCGREGCKVQLTQARGGKSWSILSSCHYHYAKLSYARALQPTKSSPWTNVLIHCPICPESLSGQPGTI
jgi:hypothetical protein